MILYVLRHAEAVPTTADLADEDRYLTEEGVKSVAAIGERMGEIGKMPRLIITSPLVRAVQCAQMIHCHARKSRVVVSSLLKNGADLGALRAFVLGQAEEKRVMVVGHEPQLGNFVAALLKREEAFPLRKGGCVALELDVQEEKPARFVFYLKPGKAPVTSLKKALAPPKKAEAEPVTAKSVETAAKAAKKSPAKGKTPAAKRHTRSHRPLSPGA